MSRQVERESNDDNDETTYLLRSPSNAERLLKASERARTNTPRPMSLENLRLEVGLLDNADDLERSASSS